MSGARGEPPALLGLEGAHVARPDARLAALVELTAALAGIASRATLEQLNVEWR
jgi:hypothetical protein